VRGCGSIQAATERLARELAAGGGRRPRGIAWIADPGEGLLRVEMVQGRGVELSLLGREREVAGIVRVPLGRAREALAQQ
jgi:hypothetical protein